VVTAGARPDRLVVLERVGNADNVGSIFRSAAAFGVGAVLLSEGCADPLYRKAIRTSMGASLGVPFADAEPWPAMLDGLRAIGVTTVAMTPDASARPLDEVADRSTAAFRSAAIVLGHEGDGLSAAALARCDYRARIDIAPEVDSLNVGTAAAIALYALRCGR
jgi:tRNA G18 (ribose-2'-O)-methylase SpoU